MGLKSNMIFCLRLARYLAAAIANVGYLNDGIGKDAINNAEQLNNSAAVPREGAGHWGAEFRKFLKNLKALNNSAKQRFGNNI